MEDLATVDNTLVKQYDGKYLYVLPDGKLDIDHYNRVFTQYSDIRKNDMKIELEKKIAEMNKPKQVQLIYDNSIGEILINTKDAAFNIMDDVVNMRFENDIITKNNRLFYLGIIIVCVACLLFLYLFFTDDDNKKISYESNIKIN